MNQSAPIITKMRFDQIEGWSKADKTASYQAFARSCAQMKQDNRAFSKNPEFGGTHKDWQEVCQALQQVGENPDEKTATAFFEDNFTPLAVNDPDLKQGLFTGYFEPVVKGSLSRSDQYNIPVYKKPDDLVTFNKDQQETSGLRYGRLLDGKPVAYFTRQEIEQGLFNGQSLELVWLKDRADAFFMQIQGSGRVELPDGKTIRMAYGGKTGLPYTAIGAVLIANGELEKSTVSMQSIRQWMKDNPDKAQGLMWHNKSFIFFRKLVETDPDLGPVGAQLVNLTPQKSLAVDRRFWALGTPVWLETKINIEQSEDLQTWRSLLIAQDTGSAIRGYARGDVFWGSGNKAALIAGQMKSAGTMIALLPKPLAKKLVD